MVGGKAFGRLLSCSCWVCSDAGKKINSRKRFIVTNILGLLLVACVMTASVQDRDGASHLVGPVPVHPIRFVFTEAGFAGRLVVRVERFVAMTVHIVCKPPGQGGRGDPSAVG